MRKQLAVIFPSGTRGTLLLLAGLMVATACVEVLGVASIMPFVALLVAPDTLQSHLLLGAVLHKGQQFTGLSLPAFAGVLTLALLIVSNVLALLTNALVLRFAYANSHRVSTALFAGYLQKPYLYFLSNHTADMTKNVVHEVHRMTVSVVIPLLQLVARSIVAVLVIGLLMVVNAALAVTAALVIGGLYALVFYMIRKRLNQAGAIATKAESDRFKTVQDALQGMQEIAVLGRSRYFSDAFADASLRYTRQHTFAESLTVLPKYVLEVIAFGGMVLMALVLISQGKTSPEVLATLGVFAFAGYRLMPTLQHVYAALVQVRYHKSALTLVAGELSNAPFPETATKSALALQSKCNARDISFAYPNMPALLREFSLTIPAKKTIGFAGASGSGKTTLMNLLLGLLTPSSGTILVDGVALSPQNMRQWQNTIGFVPQAIYLLDESIAANIAFGIPAEEVDMAKVEAAAKRAHIHEFVMGLKEGYASRVGERGVALSGGQRQRIAIARALYHEPSVLVLDEATSALDGTTETAVMEAVREMAGQMTIVIVAHRLSTLMVCDEVHVMEQGKIIASGSYADLIDRAVL